MTLWNEISFRMGAIRTRLVLVVLFAVVILDQATKWLVLYQFRLGESLTVIPGLFNLVRVHNRGVAFGMLSGTPDGLRELALIFTTLIALIAVFYFMVWEYYHDSVAQICLAGVLGGALGNIIDRLMHGYVVDFLDFYYGSYHWPAFNIADSAICVAVVLLLTRRPATGPVERQASTSEDSTLP